MYPVLIEIFGFPISTFGVLVALGAYVGGRIFAAGMRERGHDSEQAWSVLFWALVGGILGAKLWYVAEQVARTDFSQLGRHLFSRGGLTWYGGLVGGAAGVLVSARLHGLPIATVTHYAAPAVAIGQFFGRIGCFMVGDDYGRVTDLPWGIAFPQGEPPTFEPVHPTMLYEAAWLLFVGVLLWKRRDRSRHLMPEYLVLAGVGRFLDEFLRTNPALIGPFSNAQVTALASVALGLALWVYLRSRESTPSVQPTPEHP